NKKVNDIIVIYKCVKSYSNIKYLVYLNDNQEIPYLILGISVSKRLGNAVKRNQIKRRIRAFYQLHKNELKSLEYVVIARNPVKDMDYHEIEKSLLHVLRIAKCIK